MAFMLKESILPKVAILGVLCAIVDVCSTEVHAANSFSFSISSRRNSTGHRHIRAIFNTPEPLSPRNLRGDETLFDVEQNISTVGDRKIVQLITSVVVREKRAPPPGYEHVAGVGWYRLHLTPVTWEEARLACEAEGAHLAVLNSQEEATALKGIYAKTPSTIPGATSSGLASVGFSDLKDGRYLTIFGETLQEAGFATWNKGQPNNANDHCGTISRAEGEFYDSDCNGKFVYFCEFQP